MSKFMKFVGGKRGLSVIIGTVIGALAAFGIITPEQAEVAGGVASVLGLGGIVHSNLKAE